ncbi:hypothetical protein C5167_011334 [Papaver somniferum]|uniref:Uncharacterized protein n=1 Tax=Papaver somniferum TaxID=3469 RepID=A0A4Y7K5L6_PAPSO|nr:hypothetical protein C5167_011334 [Papaver somniferum]
MLPDACSLNTASWPKQSEDTMDLAKAMHDVDSIADMIAALTSLHKSKIVRKLEICLMMWCQLPIGVAYVMTLTRSERKSVRTQATPPFIVGLSFLYPIYMKLLIFLDSSGI